MPRSQETWQGKVIPKTVRFQRNEPGIGPEIVMHARLHSPKRFEGRIVELSFANRIELIQHIQDCVRLLGDVGTHLPDTLG